MKFQNSSKCPSSCHKQALFLYDSVGLLNYFPWHLLFFTRAFKLWVETRLSPQPPPHPTRLDGACLSYKKTSGCLWPKATVKPPVWNPGPKIEIPHPENHILKVFRFRSWKPRVWKSRPQSWDPKSWKPCAENHILKFPRSFCLAWPGLACPCRPALPWPPRPALPCL
jgi:hypothetical protein